MHIVQNPGPRKSDPRQLLKAYDDLAQWAKPTMRWLTQNSKLDKPPNGSKWMARGVSLLPARDIRKFYQPAGKWDQQRLDAFSVTKEQILAVPDVCPGSSEGCRAVCLSDAGKMSMPAVKNAQIRGLTSLTGNRQAVLAVVAAGIADLVRQARGEGRKTHRKVRVGIRLNITSDLPWENYSVKVDHDFAKWLTERTKVRVAPGTYDNLMDLFPRVVFYDYTKVWPRMARYLKGGMPDNYHLTWSMTEEGLNRLRAIEVLTAGGNVAVPFAKTRNQPLPRQLTFVVNRETEITYPVVDADKHDIRPLDPAGTISGLRLKLSARQRGSVSDRAAASFGLVIEAPSPHAVVHVDVGIR